MKQKQRKQPKETNTAYHEAGHAVADVRFEFGCDGVTIIPRRAAGTLGHASCYDDGCEDFLKESGKSVITINAAKAEQKVISLLAGYAAEVEHDPACEAQARLGADSDFEKARNTLRELGAKRKLHPRLKKAREFVSSNWRAIEMVARDLLETKKLDGTEVESIVEIADGEPGVAVELARYRALRGLGPTSQFPFTVSSRTASGVLTVRVPSPSVPRLSATTNKADRGKARDKTARLVGVNPHHVTDAAKPVVAAPEREPEGVRGHRGRKAAGGGDKETTARSRRYGPGQKKQAQSQ